MKKMLYVVYDSCPKAGYADYEIAETWDLANARNAMEQEREHLTKSERKEHQLAIHGYLADAEDCDKAEETWKKMSGEWFESGECQPDPDFFEEFKPLEERIEVKWKTRNRATSDMDGNGFVDMYSILIDGVPAGEAKVVVWDPSDGDGYSGFGLEPMIDWVVKGIEEEFEEDVLLAIFKALGNVIKGEITYSPRTSEEEKMMRCGGFENVETAGGDEGYLTFGHGVYLIV